MFQQHSALSRFLICIRTLAYDAPLRQIAVLLIFSLLISLGAFPEETSTPAPQRASELLTKLLARDTTDGQWLSFEKEFEAMPPKMALPALFPEIAKGIPL